MVLGSFPSSHPPRAATLPPPRGGTGGRLGGARRGAGDSPTGQRLVGASLRPSVRVRTGSRGATDDGRPAAYPSSRLSALCLQSRQSPPGPPSGPPAGRLGFPGCVVSAVLRDGVRDLDEGEAGLAFGGPRRTRAGGRKGLRCASFEPRAVPVQSGDSGTTEGAGAAGAEEVAEENNRSQDPFSLRRPGSGPAAAPGSERRGNAR